MRNSVVIHFRRDMLDLAGRKTNIRAHDVLDATIECRGCQNFSQSGHGLNRVLETDNEDMQHRESTHFFTFLFSGIESGKRPS